MFTKTSQEGKDPREKISNAQKLLIPKKVGKRGTKKHREGCSISLIIKEMENEATERTFSMIKKTKFGKQRTSFQTLVRPSAGGCAGGSYSRSGLVGVNVCRAFQEDNFFFFFSFFTVDNLKYP